jgi:repressor LexA
MTMLNQKEKKLLNFIAEEINTKGYPPSIREMMDIIAVSSLRGVTYHLDELQRKGYLLRERKSRSITILDRARNEISSMPDDIAKKWTLVPYIGNIAAGNPIEAIEYATEHIPVSSILAKNEHGYFALRVNGDSMILDHILDNDIVIIKIQNTAKNGDIVVAIIDNSATLKRFYRENNYYRLQPSNPDYEPIIIYGNLIINGVMVGLIRENYN